MHVSEFSAVPAEQKQSNNIIFVKIKTYYSQIYVLAIIIAMSKLKFILSMIYVENLVRIH